MKNKVSNEMYSDYKSGCLLDDLFYSNKDLTQLLGNSFCEYGGEKDNFVIAKVNRQNNSTNGILQNKDKRYFFKVQNIDCYYSELEGYFTVYNKFPVPRLKRTFCLGNSGIIIYNYEDTIGEEAGLLNDLIIKKEQGHCDQEDNYGYLEIIKDNYRFKQVSNKYPMQRFFEDRVDSRLIKWYKDKKWMKYIVDIGNGESYSTQYIVDECISYFSENRKYECVLSHGDLNTLNIGTKPIFFDFVTSGYNYIVAEISVFIFSILIFDFYFTPKYHSGSYKNHEKIFDFSKDNEPNILYVLKDNKLQIQSKLVTSKTRKDIALRYLEGLSFNRDYIIYYLVMRILTVFNINNYETKDKIYSIFIIHYFYHNLKAKRDLKEIIEEMGMI